MSSVQFKDGKYFLTDSERTELLLDVRTPLANRSRIHSQRITQRGVVEFPLASIVNASTQKIFKKTAVSMAELVIYLRIVARLLRKPQIHKILRIGQWSPLTEALAEILPKFNPENKFYCLSETRPLGKISSVNFMFAEGGEYLLPEDRFDTIIFPQSLLPLEVMLATKTHGKVYFVAQSVEESLRPQAKKFQLTLQSALFELEISPELRQEFKRQTPQGQLEEKKAEIAQIVVKLPNVLKERNSRLDEYITEVIQAEKLLAKIFPALHSDTIKFNFNLLKEYLIDLRLGNGSVARLSRQYEVLVEDLMDS